MQVVLLDLPERDAFAISLLISKMRPAWGCQASRSSPSPLPGDLLVLDISGRQVADVDETSLDAWLNTQVGGRPAVLLTAALPAPDKARAAASGQLARWRQRGWSVLPRPFSATQMCDALQAAERHAATGARGQGQAASAPAAAPSAPQARPPARSPARVSASGAPSTQPSLATDPLATCFCTSLFGQLQDMAAPLAQSLPPPEIGEGRLSLAQFGACARTSPHPACADLLHKLAGRLMQGRPLEMSLTMINSFIFHPAEGWAATNTPVSALRMVCKSRSLVQHIQLSDIHAQINPAQRARQRGMRTHALDEVLYTLAQMGECRLPH